MTNKIMSFVIKKIKLSKGFSVYLVCLGYSVFLTSCATNTTLAVFDLGDNRIIKVSRHNLNVDLPIYCETFINGKSIDKTVIENEGVLVNYRYEIFKDISNQKFALVQIAPHSTSIPEAVIDFTNSLNNDTHPLFCSKYSQHPCDSSAEACKGKSNRIIENIEQNNPDVKLTKFIEDPNVDCRN